MCAAYVWESVLEQTIYCKYLKVNKDKKYAFVKEKICQTLIYVFKIVDMGKTWKTIACTSTVLLSYMTIL